MSRHRHFEPPDGDQEDFFGGTATTPPPAAFPPPPPTGPVADVPTTEQGQHSAYRLWRGTAEGEVAYRWIEDRALGLFRAGETRISPRTLVGVARDHLKTPINDHFSPWIADDLIRAHRELLDVIERRRRRKPGEGETPCPA